MTPEEAIQYYQANTQETVEVIKSLKEEVWQCQPMPTSWSPMQVMQHLLLTERGMGGLFKAPQQPANRPNLQKVEQIIGTMADRTQIRNAPERVQPPAIETLSQADAVQLFEAGRLKTLEKAQASDFGIELLGYSSPYFGHMTASELLVFLAAHCQRHLVQIKQAQI